MHAGRHGDRGRSAARRRARRVVPTAAGPVAVTVTIGGVDGAASCAQRAGGPGARARKRSTRPRRKRRGSFFAYRPNIERDALRRENVRATDEIVAALNERRILLAYEPVVATIDPAAGFLRMPDARPARRRHAARRPATSCRSPNGSASCACSTIGCSNSWSTSWPRRRRCRRA